MDFFVFFRVEYSAKKRKLSMVPRCIACCLGRFDEENYRYVNEFTKADKNIPPSTYTEKVVTGLVLGILTTGCSPLYPFYHIAACVIASAPCQATRIEAFPEGLFSTGLYRDCTVLKQTFKNRQELLPTYQINRSISRSISSDTDSLKIDISISPDNVFSPKGVFRPISQSPSPENIDKSFIMESFLCSSEIVVPRSILKIGGKNYTPKKVDLK